MKTTPNRAVRELRQTIGRTQAEFAAMIGASKHTVVSWETGRNKLSAAFARRIAFATGADKRCLLHNYDTVIFDSPLGYPKVYEAADFERHRQTLRGSSDAEAARHHLRHCTDTLELLMMAATQSGGGKLRDRLPAVLDSFIQWCEQTREEFKLGGGIDELLWQRRFEAGMTQTYGEWRAMQKGNPAAAQAAGFKDDPGKREAEELRLALKLVPGWAPGRSMKPPTPAIMETVPAAGRTGSGRGARGLRWAIERENLGEP